MQTDPYEMSSAEFKAALEKKTTPAAVFKNARRIYDYLAEIFGQECMDSVLREWAFEWWSEKKKKDYRVIYKKWLNIK